MDTTISILRGASVTVGGLLLLAAFVLYEDEKKKLQSRLETLWIKVRDLQIQGVTRRTAFMRVVSEGVDTVLNFVYGPRLFSFRALAAATCLSISSTVFSMPIFAEFSSAGGIVWSLVLMLGFGFMAGPFLIVLFDEKFHTCVSIVILVVCGVLLARVNQTVDPYIIGKTHQAILIGATIIITDFLLVGAIRWVSVKAATSQSFWRIIGWGAASIVIGLIAAPLPAYFGFGISWTSEQDYALAFMFLAFTNLFETLAALLFLFVAIGMVAHWLLWPTISRILYPLANESILGNRRALCAAGVALIALGNKALADWIKELW